MKEVRNDDNRKRTNDEERGIIVVELKDYFDGRNCDRNFEEREEVRMRNERGEIEERNKENKKRLL